MRNWALQRSILEKYIFVCETKTKKLGMTLLNLHFTERLGSSFS